jgi:hypothetical protein
MPVATKTTPRLRTASLDDYPRIQLLESSHGLLTLSEQDWRNLWLTNPLRHRIGESWPIGWVLENEAGALVGSLTNVPSLYTYRGRALIAATGRAWVVEPEYRATALWLMDEYFNQEGADLFINNTVNSLAVDPFSEFGSSRIPLGDWETAPYWITGYRGFAATALRLTRTPLPGMLARPAAAALWLKDSLTVGAIPPHSKSATVAEACAFDARFDGFWDELVTRNPVRLLSLRDSQTLSWHFAASLRQGHVRIFTATLRGRLRAYCILKRQDHPPSGLRRMRLVDFQCLETEEDLLPGLLRAAMRCCGEEGIHVLEHVGGNLPKMRALDRYAPYRRKLAAWPFYYKAADPALDAELKEPLAWDPSAFDGDASL